MSGLGSINVPGHIKVMLFGIGGTYLVCLKNAKYDPIYNSDTSKHNCSKVQGGHWNNGDLTVKDAHAVGTPARTKVIGIMETTR
jgi:hypothetical protein